MFNFKGTIIINFLYNFFFNLKLSTKFGLISFNAETIKYIYILLYILLYYYIYYITIYDFDPKAKMKLNIGRKFFTSQSTLLLHV